jgi:hypothetical protein
MTLRVGSALRVYSAPAKPLPRTKAGLRNNSRRCALLGGNLFACSTPELLQLLELLELLLRDALES